MTAQHESDIYAHLLQRIALALEGAETDHAFRNHSSVELEISGLSGIELALIQAYLQHDPELHGGLSEGLAAASGQEGGDPRFPRAPGQPPGPLSPRVLPR
ncbi:hypothetical protein [Pseudomonas sp. UBA6310]|uniref:hypothetical protein n=1 Tax=Pseudomonas sp. UBA6310 TaxID=1947327 RepID=UPI00257F4C49|nr:hypothetical protein [Pseudomonas sp. UBA6310]